MEFKRKFLSEIIKPWEILNQELKMDCSVRAEINDFITKASSLAIVIEHFPEVNSKLKPADLAKENRDFEIIYDLADSLKHGELRNPQRNCSMRVASVFEKNEKVHVRFLRNIIKINHATHGSIDFMKCTKDSALFIMNKIGMGSNWSPSIAINNFEFSDTMILHQKKHNQILPSELKIDWNIVQLNHLGEYENVDLNGTIKMEVRQDIV